MSSDTEVAYHLGLAIDPVRVSVFDEGDNWRTSEFPRFVTEAPVQLSPPAISRFPVNGSRTWVLQNRSVPVWLGRVRCEFGPVPSAGSQMSYTK